MADTPTDVPLDEEAGKAWVLDALEALDDQSFVFAVSSLGALMKALLLRDPRPETLELSAAIEVYLGTRGVTLPF